MAVDPQQVLTYQVGYAILLRKGRRRWCRALISLSPFADHGEVDIDNSGDEGLVLPPTTIASLIYGLKRRRPSIYWSIFPPSSICPDVPAGQKDQMALFIDVNSIIGMTPTINKRLSRLLFVL
jgi:hypothetical protein